ncbi:hypothetical protein GCM10027452_29300 [Micromonospora halotolerans]
MAVDRTGLPNLTRDRSDGELKQGRKLAKCQEVPPMPVTLRDRFAGAPSRRRSRVGGSHQWPDSSFWADVARQRAAK